MDKREAKRLALAHSLDHGVGPAFELAGEILDQLDRGHHRAVACGLEKPHVLRVGVNHVHVVEIDLLSGQPAAQLPGDDEIAGDADRHAVQQEEPVAQVRI